VASSPPASRIRAAAPRPAPPGTIRRHWDKAWDTLTSAQQTERTTVDAANEKKVWAGATTTSLSAELQDGVAKAKAYPDAGSWQDGMPWLKTEKKTKKGTTPVYVKKHFDAAQKAWGSAHKNNGGLLPGVTGAGGYVEYYAQPAADVAAYVESHQKQPLGKNRILRQTNAAGKSYYWASTDHYTSVTFINDAGD
jgi:hypothetical protein